MRGDDALTAPERELLAHDWELVPDSAWAEAVHGHLFRDPHSGAVMRLRDAWEREVDRQLERCE